MKKTLSIITVVILCESALISQERPYVKDSQIKINFNESGSHFFRFTLLNQVWLRHTEMNPGSTLYGSEVSNCNDIGIRRLRLQAFGQLNDRVFIYTQFGQNNYSVNTSRYSGSFFHDAIVQYTILNKFLSIGGGLTGWSGMSRYSSPAVGNSLNLDLPLYQQATNGVNDQFLRKLSIYAKGKIEKLDYRIALTSPMAIQNSSVKINDISSTSEFASTPSKMQTQTYLMYQFFDQEYNTTPYNISTYLGKKKMLNLGAGIIYQPNAMWHSNTSGDTLYSAMNLIAADIYFDSPLNEIKGNAITTYACFSLTNFGPKYIRNLGVMNPTNGINSKKSFNGTGNAFPLIGTGQTIFIQVGYKFQDQFINEGTLQPYVSVQYSDFEALDRTMIMYEAGLNWYLLGSHASKLTLGYQSRPIFDTDLDSKLNEISRKGMAILQYQISI